MTVRSSSACLALLVASAFVPVASAQTTRHVATTGSDAANTCVVAASPCLTIQHAITASDPGDIVEVGAGVYTSAVVVDRSLTIRGAAALGLPGTTQIEVAGLPVGVAIAASGVTLDGLVITGDAQTWAGVLINATAATGDLSAITVTRTTIRTIRGANPFSSIYSYGHGIFSVGENVGGTRRTISGLALTNNVIEDGGGANLGGGTVSAGSGIFLYSIAGGSPGAGATITGNTVRTLADGVRSGVPQPGIGIAVADEGNGGPSSGALVSGNTYESMSGGFTVYAAGSAVEESRAAFTAVPALGVNVGTMATVDEAALQPYVYSDAVPRFPFSRAYFADAASALAGGAPAASVNGVAALPGPSTVGRDGADIVVTSGGSEILRLPGGTGALALTGTPGDDVLEVDLSVGSPIPTGGLSFDGAAGDDGIRATGTATSVAHTFDDATSGAIAFDGRTITYTGLEPIWDLVAAATRTFTFTGAADDVTISDDGMAGDGVSQIDSPLSEIVYFAHPTGLVTVNTLGGADAVSLGTLDTVNRPDVRIDAGADADDVTITPQTGVAVEAWGGAPAVAPGDVLALTYVGTGATLVKAGGDGTIAFSGGEGTITFTSFETTPQPDLAVGITIAPAPGYPASVQTITVSLANTGGIGTSGVLVAFAMPAGLELLSATPPAPTSVITTATTAKWTVPSIGGGQSMTLPILVRVLTDVSQVPVTAEVMMQDAPDFDSTPGDGAGDDFASRTFVVGELAALPNNALALAVTFDPQGRAFAATYGYGIYRSTPSGGWVAVNTGLTNPWVWDVQAHPSGALVATTWGGGVFRSVNQGATWTHVPSVVGQYMRGLAVASDGALYATGDAIAPLATSETGTARVWRSTDAGATWTALPWITRTAIEPWSIATDPANPRILYLGTRKGAYKSIDAGTTWLPTGFFGKGADAFGITVTLAGTVLIGTREGIRRSTDGGVTFSPVYLSVPAGTRSRNVYDIEYHPVSGRLYVAHWGRPGVVVSTNDGGAFTDVPLLAVPTAPVERVAVAPDGRMFMMLEGGGMMVHQGASPTGADADVRAPDGLSLALGGVNPVRGQTALRVGVPSAARARLDVYDALGRTVATLLDGEQAAGWQAVSVDAAAWPAGVYVARLTADGRSATTRFVVVR